MRPEVDVRVRPARPEDVGEAARLILEPAPSLELVLGSRRAALRVARASFLARRSIHSHRLSVVAEVGGRVAGLACVVPGEEWPRLRVPTGLVMLRAAPWAAYGLIRRGRVLDRLTPPVPADSLFVSALAVRPDMRSRGIGAALMARVDEEAGRRGRARVTLDVGMENERARAFYARLGLVEVSRIETTARDRRLLPATGSLRLERPVRP